MKKIAFTAAFSALLIGGLFLGVKQFSGSSSEASQTIHEDSTTPTSEQIAQADEIDSVEDAEVNEQQNTSLEESEEVKENEETSSSKESEKQYEEFSRIHEHINVNDFHADVVEDNRHKRIILFSDASDHKQYKSIFIKHKNYLKLIDFNDGLVYKGQL